ncbi:MAG: hypothetical protein FJ290_20965 [Planctomycetes bacterium]|nr:hypothetical protein [Planctomycetota bacterium]
MLRNELELRTNARDATWSVSWRGASLLTAARYGIVRQEAQAIQADYNYLKFRMYQEDGDWHAYIGCLQFGGEASGKGAECLDSFREQTPPERYVSATNVTWRTTVEGLISRPHRAARTPHLGTGAALRKWRNLCSRDKWCWRERSVQE